MEWSLQVLRNYAVFDGRARRREYWYFVLFNVVISIVLGVVDGVTGTLSEEHGFGLLGGLYMLAVLLPSLAVGVRRLHDIGRSGWLLLIGIVPIVGAIALLILACLDSQPGDNEYGPNPKGVAQGAAA